MSEVRLIDANAYAAEMKVRQDACKKEIDAAIDEIDEEKYDRLCGQFTIFVEAKLVLDEQPTVDAVPVCRCCDCKWCEYPAHNSTKYGCKLFDRCVKHDWFCADGERE